MQAPFEGAELGAALHEGGAGAHHADRVRAGEVEAEARGAAQQAADVGGAGEQVVDELAAVGLLAPHELATGELVALGQGGDGVVGGPQDDLTGGHHAPGVLLGAGDGGQVAPQAPGRGEVEVQQGPQRHARARRPLPHVAVAGGAVRWQPAPLDDGVPHGVEEVGQQGGVQVPRVAGRVAGDRGEVLAGGLIGVLAGAGGGVGGGHRRMIAPPPLGGCGTSRTAQPRGL